SLFRTSITGPGLKVLANLKNLRLLNVEETGVNYNADVAALQKALPSCKILCLIQPVMVWSGSFLDEKLRAEAPRDCITDEKVWRKLCAAWGLKKKVDFEKQLVVVGTAGCAKNRIGHQFRLDEKGDLNGNFIATNIACPGFVYMILVFDRAGIES